MKIGKHFKRLVKKSGLKSLVKLGKKALPALTKALSKGLGGITSSLTSLVKTLGTRLPQLAGDFASKFLGGASGFMQQAPLQGMQGMLQGATLQNFPQVLQQLTGQVPGGFAGLPPQALQNTVDVAAFAHAQQFAMNPFEGMTMQNLDERMRMVAAQNAARQAGAMPQGPMPQVQVTVSVQMAATAGANPLEGMNMQNYGVRMRQLSAQLAAKNPQQASGPNAFEGMTMQNYNQRLRVIVTEMEKAKKPTP